MSRLMRDLVPSIFTSVQKALLDPLIIVALMLWPRGIQSLAIGCVV